ncbi:MAG TPA: DUF222 domain-containing protein, partial [Candidatus Eisenbacteria bacterium]|nr:DUF222 domain-containing protein [Candidatus Eisenbacteria bacterium]
LDIDTVAGWVADLVGLDRDVDDEERVDQIRVLEELKAAAAAAQARVAAAFDVSQRAVQAAAGVRPGDLGKGIAAQVGLARRESPTRGAQHLGLAKVLVAEMPHTLDALTTGRLREWRATLLARETATLSREHRAVVDRELAGDPARLDGLGDQALAAAARKIGYRLDPHAAVRRARRCETERRVTCRPAPDTMAYLTALLPVKQAVAAHAALTRAADTARAAGDPRSRGQVMADTLVQRVTGQSTADAVPVSISLLITDRTLLRGDPEPAHLPGHGPIPAGLARDWVTGHHGADADPEVRVWLRRLYTHPGTGDLIGMDSHARTFPAGLRNFIRLRDGGTCRTPWCDAPIRHTDHPHPHAAGGPTTATNAQGLCEACNYAKQAPGWHARPDPGRRRHTITTTTPTGHHYHSTAPPPPGDPPAPPSRLETYFTNLLLTA